MGTLGVDSVELPFQVGNNDFANSSFDDNTLPICYGCTVANLHLSPK